MISKSPVRLPIQSIHSPTSPVHPSTHPIHSWRCPGLDSILPPTFLLSCLSLQCVLSSCCISGPVRCAFQRGLTGTQTRTHKGQTPAPGPRDPALLSDGTPVGRGLSLSSHIARPNKPQRYPRIQPTYSRELQSTLQPTQTWPVCGSRPSSIASSATSDPATITVTTSSTTVATLRRERSPPTSSPIQMVQQPSNLIIVSPRQPQRQRH